MSDYIEEMNNEMTEADRSLFQEALIRFNHAVMANNATRQLFHAEHGVIAPRVMRIQDIAVRYAHNDLLEVLQKINFPSYMPVTLGTLHTLIHAELRERGTKSSDEILDAIENIVRDLRFYGEGDIS